MKLLPFVAMCAAWIFLVAMVVCLPLGKDEWAVYCSAWSLCSIVVCFILSAVLDVIDELRN